MKRLLKVLAAGMMPPSLMFSLGLLAFRFLFLTRLVLRLDNDPLGVEGFADILDHLFPHVLVPQREFTFYLIIGHSGNTDPAGIC